MGHKFQVIIFICCLCLIDHTTGMRGGNGKDFKQGAGRCQGWEIDLRNNLTDPGNISDYINDFYENISDLSPGCVRTFSLNVTHSNLVELMSLLNAKYDNLNPGTRKQIYKWVEDIYTKTPDSGMKTMDHIQDERRSKDQGKKPEKGKGKGKHNFITLDVLHILGRFIVQAPTSTLKSISKGNDNTVCQLFKSSSDLLEKLFDLTPVQAHIFFNGLDNCADVDTKNETVIAKLGQLACFYPTKQLKSLHMKAVKALQDKLHNCTRNIKKIYQAIIEVIGVNISSAESLKDLGDAAIGLKISQLSNITEQVIVGAVEVLKNVRGWSKGQAKVFVKKYMEVENVTANKLKNLGYLAFGFGAKTFSKFKGQELLTAFTDKEVQESVNFMLPVQKKSIMKGILESMEIDSVLQLLPETLVPQIPVKKLIKAHNLSNFTFLSKDRPWNKGQSVAAIDRVKNQLNDVKNISKLKAVIKGIPCSLINTLKPDVVKVLANNPFASSNQIRCFSIKFFKDKKNRNPNYFSNLTSEDINEFLISYMIFQPGIEELKLIPRALCPNMVELISQANITMLPRSSPRRKQLLDYATNCLNLTVSAMTEDDGNSLGSLVCALSPDDIKNLNNTVFLAIVDQLQECGRFDEAKKTALRQKILSAYPPLSEWTVDELTELRSLLGVLTYEDLKSIPNNEDIQTALLEILSAHKSTRNFVPPDFDNSPNVSALYQKVFNILNSPSQSRRKRATACPKRPTAEEIETLGEANSLWTVEQLSCISDEDFINSLDTLTQVEGFNIAQLRALKSKALEAFGMNISNDQLASLKKITLGFDESEVVQYFTAPDIDTIGAISDYQEWASTEHSKQAKAIMKNFLGQRSDSQLSSTDLVGMGYFLCTRSSGEIKNINVTAYSTAAKEIGETMCPNIETLTALKNKAVEAFPSVDTWTGAQLQEIGVVAAGLSKEEVPKLMTSAVSFLTPGAVSKFPSNVFSAMTAEQLRNLGPQNYGAVTDAQKAALSQEKLQALKENAGFERAIDNAGATSWSSVRILTLLVLSLTATLH
ncbi:otoancorin-like isoform X2 [Stegostoma tigrinum]|nr:otoancorin-like isoform X2 [Stegostoma tigrinum]XP_048418182.1 otoancorin-like isoform X2 [Stegostoma tigrinum]XP_048418184.1 otoancorin-like isoform X2 [Stegostoma tigrinum]XP_048418185.1 otoancorin-like isoform X2 [Stegostoma tigrinum]XP_048418187.1 otoancorin-like isoform X2 [Stegostoma tigrinum]